MSLALCAVIAAPARVRPLVGATMAAFAVAVCYSILELGSHYPSDVLGGLLVATMWTLLGMATFWTLEASPPGPRLDPSASRPPGRRSQRRWPLPCWSSPARCCVAARSRSRDRTRSQYAAEHPAFTVGAAAIGALALMIATGATLALDRLR